MRLRSLVLPALLLFCVSVSVTGQNHPNDDWNRPFKPFRVIGDIYYVGTNDLACYLITTPSGHILLDTALEESAPIVKANIAELGFKLSDIKIILSSHAHFDHVAGHALMKEATGATVYASAKDAEVLESGGTKGFFPLGSYKPVKVDRILKDGETVSLGAVKMRAHFTPGHTEGNTAWTTEVVQDGRKYDVVFVSSMSINTGVHLVNFPAWPGVGDAYKNSFARLKKLHCDIFLGPHARFFDMENKVRRMGENPKVNPFIDPNGYQKYIADFEAAYNKQLGEDSKRR
jgi:metallo-beta-lactamase class B